jgi:hypothetical protein
MSTITFANGKSVNFNGTPTPADIDFVAKQMGVTAGSSSVGAPPPTQDPHTLPTIGPTGKPSTTVNWANPSSSIPGATIGQGIGTWWAKNMPQSLGGAPDAAKHNVTPGPTGEAMVGDALRSTADVASLALGPEVGVLGSSAIGAASGAGQAAGNAMVNNDTAGQVGSAAVKGGVIGGITAGAVTGALKLVGTAGAGIVFQNVKPTAADFKDGLPSTATGFSDLLKQYNISGSLPNMLTQTQSTLGDLSTQLRTTLGSSDATPVDLTSVYDQTVADVTSGSDKLKGFGSNTKIQGALNQLQNEVLEVNPSGKMSIPDAQMVKQAAGGIGSWQYGKIDPEATALETVYNKFYTNLKTTIENASPAGVQEINGKIQDLIPVQNALVRRIPIAQRNAALGLSDMIALTASVMNPSAIPLELANIARKSTWFGNLISGAGGLASGAPAIGNAAAGIIGQPGTSTPATVQGPPQQ